MSQAPLGMQVALEEVGLPVRDARCTAHGGIWSCVVALRCAGDGLVSGADLETYVSRAVWDAVGCLLGAPDVLTVDCRGDRVIVRAVFDPRVSGQVDLVAAVKEPVITAMGRVGLSAFVTLGLAAE